jgi:SAM-dependent methyltransferase
MAEETQIEIDQVTGELAESPPEFSGVCNICGQEAKFVGSDPTLYREALLCSVCNTNSRYRSIARGLLRAIHELTGVSAASLAALENSQSSRTLEVYDTQLPFYYTTLAYPIPDALHRSGWIAVHLSTYRANDDLGLKLAPNTTNQNLERLTFPDNSFDVVITSDVMEHVRLDADAHREIVRVLKPGGIYLFTVPHYRQGRDTIFQVAVVDPDDPSKDEFLMEKEYHGDTNSPEDAALSYRIYGTVLDEQLRELGFSVEYTREDFPEMGILNSELFYCCLTSKVEPTNQGQ